MRCILALVVLFAACGDNVVVRKPTPPAPVDAPSTP